MFLKTIKESLIIFERCFLKMIKTPEQLMDTLIFPIVFLLMFTYIFGGAISGSTANYLPIVIPGVLVFCVLNTAGASGTNLKEDIETGIFNRFKSMPISRIAPLAGTLICDSIRFVISILVTFILAIIMGFWSSSGFIGIFLALIFTVFCGWCISWIFAFIGLKMRTSGSVQGISFVITMPLMFISNALVPVDTMPKILEIIAKINPVTYMVNAVKNLLICNIFSQEIFISLILMIAVVTVFVPLTLKVYMKKQL